MNNVSTDYTRNPEAARILSLLCSIFAISFGVYVLENISAFSIFKHATDGHSGIDMIPSILLFIGGLTGIRSYINQNERGLFVGAICYIICIWLFVNMDRSAYKHGTIILVGIYVMMLLSGLTFVSWFSLNKIKKMKQ